MPKEIELRVLGVDRKEVESRLRRVGAKFIAQRDFKRVELLIKGKVSNVYKGKKTWARVRTDGKQTTITLKERNGKKINMTKEWEVEVDDFKTAVQMFCRLYKPTIYGENKRLEYQYGGCQITIDKWPELPWIVEIEGESVGKVRGIYKKLDLKKGRLVDNMSIVELYRKLGIDWVAHMEKNRGKLNALLAE